MAKNNSVLYGALAGIGLLLFYLTVVSVFQGIGFAFLNLRSLWYFIFPLAIGFGIQIGLYFSIRHTAQLNATVAGTGGISAGAMIACCSHFLVNLVPIIGFSGIALFLVQYQKWFLGLGILSNALGIYLMLKHKKHMRKDMKGGHLHG